MKKILIGFLITTSFVCQAQDYVRFEEKGKFGFKNNEGKVTIPAIYTNASETFSKGLVGVEKAGQWGYIDSTGKLVIPYKYQEVGKFSSFGIALVWLADRQGGINTTGKIIIPCIYDVINEGQEVQKDESVFEVMLKGKKGIMVPWGVMTLPVIYDDLTYINTDKGGLYIVKKDKKYGVVDNFNETKIPFLYEFISHDGSNKRFRMKSKASDTEYIFCDYDGKFVQK